MEKPIDLTALQQAYNDLLAKNEALTKAAGDFAKGLVHKPPLSEQ